jgi:hypothetical protein
MARLVAAFPHLSLVRLGFLRLDELPLAVDLLCTRDASPDAA